MSQIVIVFAITIAMSVVFFTGWIPIIATAFCVPMLLQLTGVLTAAEAWSGFSNTTVISFIPIFTMAAVLKKSSFIYEIKKYVQRLNSGSRGKFKVLAALALSTCLLTTFMNAASAVVVMTPIILSLAAEVGISQKKALKLCGDISSNSVLVFPFGLTLTQYLSYNAYLEAGGADASYMFGVMDQTILKLPIFIVWIALMIFVAPKLMHVKEEHIEVGTIAGNAKEEVATTLTPTKDKLAKILFFGCVLAMIIGVQFFKIPIYITCGIFAVIAIACKIITIQDAIDSMSWVSIIIIACTLPLATAFNKSGASAVLANAVNMMIGGARNTFILAAVFFLIPALLTHFMSNTACAAIFSPLAVAIAVALDVDP